MYVFRNIQGRSSRWNRSHAILQAHGPIGQTILWDSSCCGLRTANINIVISSMSRSWYFDDVDAPSECSSTFSAFKTALTSSAGTISIGSIVTAIFAANEK